MDQYGFFFDQSRCAGCHTCTLACKNWNGLPPGPLKYLRIHEYEKGSFPDVRVHFQWVHCHHCEKPSCVDNCPDEAIYKEPKYGAVLLDSEKCTGCRMCYDSCPYGAPVFASDDPSENAQKCNMCIDRLEVGNLPVCVLACPLRALDFGPMQDLKQRYGENRDLEDLPSSKTTQPAVLFKPHAKKRQLVPYNSQKAVELLMRRDALSAAFTSPEVLTNPPRGIIGRSKMEIKTQSVDSFMRNTRCDEG